MRVIERKTVLGIPVPFWKKRLTPDDSVNLNYREIPAGDPQGPLHLIPLSFIPDKVIRLSTDDPTGNTIAVAEWVLGERRSRSLSRQAINEAKIKGRDIHGIMTKMRWKAERRWLRRRS